MGQKWKMRRDMASPDTYSHCCFRILHSQNSLETCSSSYRVKASWLYPIYFGISVGVILALKIMFRQSCWWRFVVVFDTKEDQDSQSAPLSSAPFSFSREEHSDLLSNIIWSPLETCIGATLYMLSMLYLENMHIHVTNIKEKETINLK